VIVLVAALVVEQGAVLHDLFDQRHGDMGMRRPGGLLTLPGSARGSLSGKFQHIESNTRIAIGKNRYLLQRILIDGDVHLTQAALLVRERPPQNGQNMLFTQTSQCEDARTGEEPMIFTPSKSCEISSKLRLYRRTTSWSSQLRWNLGD